MKPNTILSIIKAGAALFYLGILIEWKRKKLNRLIRKGRLLSSPEVHEANNHIAPYILKWQQLEDDYLRMISFRIIPAQK